ncbi:hypothetical protein BK809_0002516 [Diplodia seriata]|uniref:Uncharacterized protein n=1 Tax=Diplodia seriata TaxID=420778 RepID=A0A1S8B297_9PEZI|nr:hypothetical protein BK809_0002516 [Diplodia seriata]
MPVVSIAKGMAFALIEVDSLATLSAAATGTFTAEVVVDKGWYQSFKSSNKDERGGLEDPAIGSAASALACVLSLAEGVARQRHRYAITQGVEMGRKSEIGVQVGLAKTEGEIESVQLGGGAVEVMNGRLAA